MQLSGQNLSLLQNSISYNNGDDIHDADVNKEEKSVFAKTNKRKHEVDSAVFVQTHKDNRTSKVPSIKIELGKNLSDLVIVDKALTDIKTGFESIENNLNIESESQVVLPNERKEMIDKHVLEVQTSLNETEVQGKKIFHSTFKLNVKIDIASSDKYQAKVNFADRFSGFDFDFEGIESDLDKRFSQIREVNKNISIVEDLRSEVEVHTKVLKKAMDKFISAGKESTLYHLSSKLDDSNLVNQMKLKASIFTDAQTLALTQVNTNSLSVLNLLP
jgi:hypothetical protein